MGNQFIKKVKLIIFTSVSLLVLLLSIAASQWLIPTISFLTVFIVMYVPVAYYLYCTLYGEPLDFTTLTTRMFIETIQDEYFIQTQLRLVDRFDSSHNGMVDALDPQTRANQLAQLQKNYDMLQKWKSKVSTNPNRNMSFQVIDNYLGSLLESYRHMLYPSPLYYIQPLLYSANQLFGCQLAFIEILTNQQINNINDARRYITRVNRTSNYIQGLIADLQAREQKNIIPPRYVLDAVIKQIETKLLVKYDSSYFLMIKFEMDIKSLEQKQLIKDPSQSRALIIDMENALVIQFMPSFKKLKEYLVRLVEEHSEPGDGCWKIDQTDDIYQLLLRYHTTTNMSPEEIHNLGKSEVRRIKKEIADLISHEYPEIKQYVDEEEDNSDDNGKYVSPNAGFGETLRKIANEPRFQFPNDEEGRNMILREYTSILRRVETQLGDHFESVPEAQVEVERVPHFREENAPIAQYLPAPLDRSRKGTCFVNLRDCSTHNKLNVKVLAYHEGTPGHHFQISVAQELKGVDIFRRLLVFNAYTEGWALYVERLADELGWYENEYERLGFLEYELWRACRLVIDTALHSRHYRWTREQAIEYLYANCDKNKADVIAEVERYIVIPGQACSYKIGQLKIIELRTKAKERLGSVFSLKEFHSVVLNSGALPLVIFEKVIDDWIISKLKK